MVKRAPARRRPRKAKPGTKGLIPAECRLDQAPAGTAEAVEAIEKAGGCLVGSYKEPLGGHPVLLSFLPIDAVEPTPFQRDLSDAHHARKALGFCPLMETDRAQSSRVEGVPFMSAGAKPAIVFPWRPTTKCIECEALPVRGSAPVQARGPKHPRILRNP